MLQSHGVTDEFIGWFTPICVIVFLLVAYGIPRLVKRERITSNQAIVIYIVLAISVVLWLTYMYFAHYAM